MRRVNSGADSATLRVNRATSSSRDGLSLQANGLAACPRAMPSRAARRAQMRGAARRPHARRTFCTLSVRPRGQRSRWVLLVALRAALLEEPGQEVDGVDRASRQPAHHRAIHPDVLQVVPRLLFDQPHRSVRAERVDTLLDEPGDPVLVSLDQLDRGALDPIVQIRPERRVGDRRST